MQAKKLTVGNFASHLAQLMSERRVCARDVAKGTGLTPAAVSRYLSGQRQPRYLEAVKLAEFFGVNPDYLLNPDKYRLPFSVAAEAVKGMEEGPPRDREYNRVLREETEKLKARQEGWEAASDVVREDPPWVDQWRDRALAAEALLDQFRELLDLSEPTTKTK